MATLLEQQLVKAIIGVLTAEPNILPTVYQQLTDRLGPIDYTSELLHFDSTPYYEVEMGEGIQRQFISFENLIDAGTLADKKLWTNQIEQVFAQKDTSQRRVNLDIT